MSLKSNLKEKAILCTAEVR